MALLCYEYFLTLGREIQYVWKVNCSFASVLFYTWRYSVLLCVLPATLDLVHPASWQTNDNGVEALLDHAIGFKRANNSQFIGMQVGLTIRCSYSMVLMLLNLEMYRTSRDRNSGSFYFYL
ncbi:hypothetical protein WOLCODRAFT_139831 [Wolfiporia cocos MD-104 SS10]|uniref:DUF6533 domain-containing protein n=1 Tax=Wolfiporia cocos (strain MD-104) TaxID=742152 RepID=A0A2H3J930_WOLCO|nr:hypothetical protein WOLCODRAFT_139831 [Wolfiporia cocos MD-104 SS10]